MVDASFVFVIPYFNEQSRLDVLKLVSYVYGANTDVIFVDDGSSDNSANLVDDACKKLAGHGVKAINHKLPANLGKSKAILSGMLLARDMGYSHGVNLDIDLPLEINSINEAKALCLEDRSLGLVSGARVRLAGSGVNRTVSRQWIGRIIATYIYLLGRIDMYDTQSPLKIYNLDVCADLLNHDFKTRWFGDVEIILSRKSYFEKNGIREFALSNWVDIAGSHFTIRRYHEVVLDLLRLSQVLLFERRRRC